MQTKPLAGINSDSHPKFQPENTYRYGLNILRSSLNSLVNEPGNEICLDMESLDIFDPHTVIGATALQDDEFLLYLYHPLGYHKIALFNTKSCELTTLIQHSDLNFTLDKIITGIFRIFNGCDRLIYFTDGQNPYRVINIDDLEQYKDDGGNWVIDRLNLSFPIATMPCFDDLVVRDGGGSSVAVGSVHFGIRYADKSGNTTNILKFSRNVPIYADSVSSDYSSINGAIHDTTGTGTGVSGSVPATSKSVEISLSNLDTDFESYIIVALHKFEGTGAVTEVGESSLQAITGTTGTYTWTGIGDMTASTVDEALTDKAIIDVVKAHEQKDNRLFLANLEEDTMDFAAIQQAANLITTRYNAQDTTQLMTMDDFEEGSKGDNYYHLNSTFLRDEVYAFGIKGNLKNGGSTPVFHIPGREPIQSADTFHTNTEAHRNHIPGTETEWDTQMLTVVASGADNITQVNLTEVKHLGFTTITDDPFGDGPGQLERWRVFNTAVNSNPSSILGNHLAYHRCDTRYPEVKDCNGGFIFPNDGTQTDFIRHHRMPDATKEASFTYHPSDYTQVLGVRLGVTFQLVNFLAALPTSVTDEVVGWEIVQAERTDANKTVIDNGHMLAMPDADDLVANPNAPNIFYENIYWIDTPRVLFNQETIRPTYVKLIRKLEYIDDIAIVTSNADRPGSATHIPGCRNDGQTTFPDTYFRTIEDFTILASAPALYTGGNTFGDGMTLGTIGGTDIRNNRSSISRYVIKLSDNLTIPGNSYAFGSDGTLDTERKNYYACFKTYNANPYSSLGTLVYHSISGCEYDSGDTLYGQGFLSRYNYKEIPSFREDDPFQTSARASAVTHFVESEINPSLRTGSDESVMETWQYNQDFTDFFDRPFITDPGQLEATYKEFLHYNDDYSGIFPSKGYFPLSDSYSYCDNCNSKYPYRIRYSDQSFQESTTDHYRTFQPLNYRDVIGSTGEITDLFKYRDRLYFTTERGVFFQNTSPQTIQTNESNFVLGTGDVFSIPPMQLTTANHSYGGQVDPNSRVATPYGVFFADINSGKVFVLTDNLEEITLQGNKEFFKDNLPFSLSNQLYTKFGSGEVLNSILSPQGVGLTACYDPCEQRYILSYKDYVYEDLTGLELISATADGIVGYDPETGKTGIVTGGVITTDQAPTNTIENKSWTVSFHVPTKTLTSFHSYEPTFLFNNDNTFFSVNNYRNNTTPYSNIIGIYEHNSEDNLQTYYTTKYASIIDYVTDTTPGRSGVYDGVDLSVTFSSKDPITSQDIKLDNIFFDNVTAYNSFQHSGKLTPAKKDPFLTPTINPTWDNNEERYSLRGLRDFSIGGASLFTSLWAETQTEYPIDKVINPLNIDLTKSLYTQARLRDEYGQLRLFFDNADNIKFSFDLSNSTNRNTFK
jgi:hypothetical protein